jgi:hypothetical protein
MPSPPTPRQFQLPLEVTIPVRCSILAMYRAGVKGPSAKMAMGVRQTVLLQVVQVASAQGNWLWPSLLVIITYVQCLTAVKWHVGVMEVQAGSVMGLLLESTRRH